MKKFWLLAVLLFSPLTGCAFLTGSVSEDEAWAVRVSMDQVHAGLERQEALVAEGAAALGKFALARSSQWADLGAQILLHQAAADGTLTEEEAQDALRRAAEERQKDADTVMAHLEAIRGLKVWADTAKAFSIVEAWTDSRLSAGEAKRRMLDKAIELKDRVTGKEQ